jgi:hypothetical protein
MDILKNICMTFDGERDCKKKRVFVSQVTDGRTDEEISRQREAALAWMKEQIGDFVVSNFADSEPLVRAWRSSGLYSPYATRVNIELSDFVLLIGDFEGGEEPPVIWRAKYYGVPYKFYQTKARRKCYKCALLLED